jgi:hypothetical protein
MLERGRGMTLKLLASAASARRSSQLMLVKEVWEAGVQLSAFAEEDMNMNGHLYDHRLAKY